MLFSSIPFLYYFLPLTLLCYFLAPRRAKNAVLLLFSLVFYAWGEPKYVLFMVVSILQGYFFGRLVEKYRVSNPRRSKLFLTASVLFSLLLLGYCKYADFFIRSFNAVTGLSVPLLRVALPIGISFYTFQILSYVVDVHRGTVAAQRNLIDLGTYIAMFPQLIAGPIVRYADIEPQLKERRSTPAMIAAGAQRFVLGLGKKVLIANVLYQLITVYKATTQPSVLYSWMYAAAYMLHIYFDFSGYSDMAIGLGKIFGFTFAENFNYPYISRSVTEFWRRWHMSLGSWFRDYVYFSLGGSRCAPWRHYLNIVIVFVCSGLWHGADWRYLAWGLATGLCAAFGVMTAKARKRLNRFNPLYRMGWFKALWQCLVTNALFCLTLVFFASAIYNTDPFAVYGSLLQGWDGLAGSWAQVSGLIYSSGIDGRLPVVLLFGCFVVFAAEHGGRSVARWIRQQVWPLRWTLYYGAAAAILFFAAFGQSAFIYQQY